MTEEPTRATAGLRLDTCPYGVVVVDDGTVRAVNDAAATLLETSRDGAVGAGVESVAPVSVESTLPALFAEGDPTERHEFEEYYPDLERWLSVTAVPTDGGVEVYLDDVTDRVTAQRETDQLQTELSDVVGVTDLLSAVLEDLVDAADHEAVTETIVRTLGERDEYEFAWLGEREPGTDRLRVSAVAGDTGDLFDRVRDHLDDLPERAALARDEARVIQPITESEAVPSAVRQAAFADGVQSFVAVPLTYGGTTYGVVGVYAAGKDTFSERAREAFETLGTMAGFAINATRNQSLLFADTITEFTVDVTEPDAPLVALSREVDAAFEVDGTVPQGQDRVVAYLASGAAVATAARESLVDHDAVHDVRVVTETETATRLEVTLGAASALQTVTTLGASVGRASFEDGRGRIGVELPSGEQVRQVGEALRRQFDADTVSKVERDRSVTTADDLRSELGSELTERQETALRTAYLAGYFESPRDSTAEEVGEALDITGSTLLHHLRTGQRKLLDTYFDGEDGRRN